ncbi:MAG: hypothetical protein IKY02_03490, partial [Lachnospiraceae bacterium]|nr:hypothetical protein [Lachnospiraceae bacterium]
MKKHAYLKKAISAVLALVLLVSLCGCSRDEYEWLSSVAEWASREAENYTLDPSWPTGILPPATDTAAPTTKAPDDKTETAAPVSSALIPEYREITKEEFSALCDELKAAASGNDFGKIRTLYDKIYSEFEQVNDNYTLSYIAYCREVSNESLKQKYQDLEELAIDLSDLALQAFRSVTQGPCAKQFKSYVDDEPFEYFSEYEDMTDQEKEWEKRETELVTQYNSIMDEYGDLIWQQDDYVNSLVGPIYLELVQLRTEKAKFYGYDNYADYADENVYYRDYDKAAAEKFHEAVKQISGDYYTLLYYTNAYFGIQNVYTSMTATQLVDKLGSISAKISPLATEYYQRLTDYKLYDISSASGRLDAGYTTNFETTDTAFIFITSDDGPRDF